MTAVQDLVRHLKANPGDRDVDGLASRFGVSSRLVGLAIQNIKTEGDPARPKSTAWADTGKSLKDIRDKVVARPLPLIVASSVAAALFVVAASLFPSTGPLSGVEGAMFRMALVVFGVAGVPLLHYLVFFFKGFGKHVFLGAATYVPLVTLALVFPFSKPQSLGILATFAVFVFIAYLLFGAPVAVVGSYVRMKKEAKARANMDRQAMLQRLLEVRHALEHHEPQPAAPTLSRRTWVAWLEQHVVWIALVLSFAQAVANSFVFSLLDPGHVMMNAEARAQAGSTANLSFAVAAASMSVTTYALCFAFGWLARRPARTALTFVATVVGHVVEYLTPFAYVSFPVIQRTGWATLLFGWVPYVVWTALGMMVRQTLDASRERARRRSNDPEALMEEMLELEWRLTPRSTSVTVMAVDVVGSTAMKQNADPLVAEWSFRAYQDWVERMCLPHGGKVHSTAGDGAIVGFEDPASAISAALLLQSKIAEFNETTNRLSTPFQVRIGVHCGDVQGDLSDVQFTRVIDIAAHIEAKAPIGGLAVSEDIVERLGRTRFVRSTVVDDLSVYVFAPTDPPAEWTPAPAT